MQVIQQLLSSTPVHPTGDFQRARGNSTGFMEMLGKAGEHYHEIQTDGQGRLEEGTENNSAETEASLEHILDSLKEVFASNPDAAFSSSAVSELQARLAKLSSPASNLSVKERSEEIDVLFQTYDAELLENELHVFFEQQRKQLESEEIDWKKADSATIQIQEEHISSALEAGVLSNEVKTEITVSALAALAARTATAEDTSSTLDKESKESYPIKHSLNETVKGMGEFRLKEIDFLPVEQDNYEIISALHKEVQVVSAGEEITAENEGRLMVESLSTALPLLKNQPESNVSGLIQEALEKAASNLVKAVESFAEPAALKKVFSELEKQLEVVKTSLGDTIKKLTDPALQEFTRNQKPIPDRLPDFLKSSTAGTPVISSEEKRAYTGHSTPLPLKQTEPEANRRMTEGYKVITDPVRFVQLLSDRQSSVIQPSVEQGGKQAEGSTVPSWTPSRVETGAEPIQVLAKSVVDTGALPQVQQALIQLGESKTAHGRQQEFIKQFQEILNRSSLQAFKNGTQQLTLILRPAHLGRIDMKLSLKDGVMTAQLTASSKGARDVLEQNLPSLRQSFSSQQLQVERIEITEQQENLLKEKEEQQEQRRQIMEQNEPEADSEEAAFSDVLENIIFNEKV